jgi:hypothetical protein
MIKDPRQHSTPREGPGPQRSPPSRVRRSLNATTSRPPLTVETPVAPSAGFGAGGDLPSGCAAPYPSVSCGTCPRAQPATARATKLTRTQPPFDLNRVTTYHEHGCLHRHQGTALPPGQGVGGAVALSRTCSPCRRTRTRGHLQEALVIIIAVSVATRPPGRHPKRRSTHGRFNWRIDRRFHDISPSKVSSCTTTELASQLSDTPPSPPI